MSERNWSESELYVRETLKTLTEKVDIIQADVQEIKTDLATHKVKSGFWGAVSGVFVSLAAKFFGGHH
jgi:hypothetical protein